uniref:Serpentine Receptor, class T n=1 Tax=Steinernema glaseri TaxID=37863 RepID=A0A1I7YMP5_9BILA
MVQNVDELQVTLGVLHIIIAILLPPINIRFIYIFLSRKHYREMECYRIMALSGILQLFAGPGAFCGGLIQVATTTGSDLHRIFLFFVILFSASIATELVLNLVMALNRVKVILNIPMASCLTKMLMALACIYSIFFTTALLSPYCGYRMAPGHYVGSYDFSKPYTQLFSKINSIVRLSSSSLAFVCYLIIIANLLCERSHSTTRFNKEWSILIYSGVRFVIDTSLAIVFFFVRLPPSPWAELAVGLTYILNQLLVSPLLYLIFNNSYSFKPKVVQTNYCLFYYWTLRKEFLEIFRFRRISYVSSAIYHTSTRNAWVV